MNSKQRKVEIVLLILFFILLCTWAYVQKFGIPSDELLRFKMPEFIFKNHRLPTLYDKELYNANFGCPGYAAQPCLPYIVGAIFMGIASFLGVPASKLYFAPRMVSVLCGVVFLYLVFAIAKELIKDKDLSRLFVATIALWPLLCFIFTYVNCDSMAMVGNALIVLNCIKGIRNQWKIKNCIGLGIGMAIVVLSYINGVGFVLAGAIIFIASYIFESKKYGQMIGRGMIAFIIAAAGFFAHYGRMIWIYGSMMPTHITRKINLAYDLKWHYGSDWRRQNAWNTMTSLKGLAKWVRTNLANFFGYFGSGEIHYPGIVYYVMIPIMVVLCILGVWFIIKRWKNIKTQNRILIVGWEIGCLITIGLSFWFCMFYDYTPQGRYSLPIIIPFALTITYGIKQLCNILKIKKLEIITLIVCCTLLMADLYAIFVLV